jgi:hypothetical protein
MDPIAKSMYIANLMQTKGMTYAQAENYLNNPNNAFTVQQGMSEIINKQAKSPSITSGSNDMSNAVTGPSFNMANYDFINPNATQKPNVLNQQPTLYGTDGTDPNKVVPKNMKEFTSKEEWMRYKESQGEDPMLAGRNWDEQMGTGNEDAPQGPMGGYNQGASGMPLWYPGGSDISTELFTMGRGIGAAKGAKGKNAAIIAGGGAALFDITRNVLAGVGYEKSNQYVENEYRKNQYGTGSRDYTRQRQYKNANPMGEMDFGRDGGMFGNFTPDLISNYKRKFEEGGEQEGMEQQPMQPQMQPQEQEEGQPQDQMQQVQMMIAQALQQGQEPQMIVQALAERGVPREQAMQMVAQVAQQMQQQNMEQSGEEPEMKKGGKFKHNVGDYIEFKVDGKIKKGKIKRIENGKIFL